MNTKLPLAGMCFAVSLALNGPAAAATDIYMSIPPIVGEATASHYVGQIQLLSYSQSVQSPAVAATADAGAGKPSCGLIKITKYIDKSSPSLVGAVVTGKIYPHAIVSFVDTTNVAGRSFEENDYTVTLTDVMFTNVQQSDASPAELIESVSLVARQFRIDYVPYSQRGIVGAKESYSVDCTTSTTY